MYQPVTERPAYTFQAGHRPLLISIPHCGTYLPPALVERLTPAARRVPDTDWHLPQLYAFAQELGASVLAATHSRYVVDINRPPDGASLYPGQSVTSLCPVDDFDDVPLYLAGAEPDAEEIERRRIAVWQPYHDKLAAELERLTSVHGVAMLWDAHSIRSVLPRFFTGKLPDFNIGTAQGNSCAQVIQDAVYDCARDAAADGFTSVVNGRFTGGFITRHYGQPARNVHAVQLEMAQSTYMKEEYPFDYRPELAARVQPHLQRMLQATLSFCSK